LYATVNNEKKFKGGNKMNFEGTNLKAAEPVLSHPEGFFVENMV